MKNTFIFMFLFTLIQTSSRADDGSFLLKGSINGVKDSTKIGISYTIFKNNEWHNIEDSTRVVDGKFIFQGNIEGVTAAALEFKNKRSFIYMEPTQMQLYIDADKPHRYQLTGTKVENENLELRKELGNHVEIIYNRLENIVNLIDLFHSLKEGDVKRDSLAPIVDRELEINEGDAIKLDSARLAFAAKHPSFLITLDLLYHLAWGEYMSLDSIRSIYNLVPEENKNSPMGKLALKKIEENEEKNRIVESTSIGAFPPDFTRESISGEIVKLSNYKNKTYVLLDFWASWCGPCLKEIPKMKEIDKEYKEKGLSIIGISLDENKNSWSNAVKKNELNSWPQILSSVSTEKSNGSFSQDNLSDLYNCDGIPFYVLIDKDGKIVAKWEHIGDAQLQELDKYLNTRNNE